MSQSRFSVNTTAVKPQQRSRTPLVLIFLLSLAPVVAAVLVYFNPDWRPAGSVAYGTLVNPQRPIPSVTALPLQTLDGKSFDLASLKGKWVLVTTDGGACPDECARKLFILRNSHASQGKEVERIARIWFITDDAQIPEKVLDAYKGTIMVRVKPDFAAKYLLADDTAVTDPAQVAKYMWIIDPLGNLILQYPEDSDPVKIRDEITKLLKNSRIG